MPSFEFVNDESPEKVLAVRESLLGDTKTAVEKK